MRDTAGQNPSPCRRRQLQGRALVSTGTSASALGLQDTGPRLVARARCSQHELRRQRASPQAVGTSCPRTLHPPGDKPAAVAGWGQVGEDCSEG